MVRSIALNAEQTNALREFFDTECFHHDWGTIAKAMKFKFEKDFTAEICKRYYLDHLAKRLPFTADEDEKLKTLIKKYGKEDWKMIASEMSDRTSRECRDRW